ncbi:hypothetical protein FA15DRAFT_643716 [Coprinopsis marcescibilis]|uniref:Uncharacterized protein n=1 Tax=Coprinopsis marcescibilis TaxID=230819 RepID=A0A5C3KQ81_COPMA|nr:hypothetical protein FA15DRAFT_643716 [Coprinopsis marcescibilis]
MLGRLRIQDPIYQSDELDAHLNNTTRPRWPDVTGYRLLVTGCALVFGVPKAALAYLGFNTAVKSVEWVYGVPIAISIYTLGLYEANTVGLLPWLFRHNYTFTCECFYKASAPPVPTSRLT